MVYCIFNMGDYRQTGKLSCYITQPGCPAVGRRNEYQRKHCTMR